MDRTTQRTSAIRRIRVIGRVAAGRYPWKIRNLSDGRETSEEGRPSDSAYRPFAAIACTEETSRLVCSTSADFFHEHRELPMNGVVSGVERAFRENITRVRRWQWRRA